MATLFNSQNNQSINLYSLHIVGRHASSCHTVIDNPMASRVHATITWNGKSWSLLDSSTNGSYVNDTRVAVNVNQQLAVGDKIYFASADSGIWQVVDLEPPKSKLIPISADAQLMILEDIAVLPDEESPELTLYTSAEGRWLCESSQGCNELNDGDKIGVASGTMWRFIEASHNDQTVPMTPICAETQAAAAHFIVSQSEEHVCLNIEFQGQRYDLGERTHHYLLLILARQYLEDQAEGVSPMERGWIDKDRLVKMLRMDEIHINMQIYRFRKQLISALPKNTALPPLIERRKGEVRFGCEQLNIEGGMSM